MVTIALIVLALGMFARNAGVGFVMVAFVWLAAYVFNPNIDSGLVWVIGLGLGYLMESGIE